MFQDQINLLLARGLIFFFFWSKVPRQDACKFSVSTASIWHTVHVLCNGGASADRPDLQCMCRSIRKHMPSCFNGLQLCWTCSNKETKLPCVWTATICLGFRDTCQPKLIPFWKLEKSTEEESCARVVRKELPRNAYEKSILNNMVYRNREKYTPGPCTAVISDRTDMFTFGPMQYEEMYLCHMFMLPELVCQNRQNNSVLGPSHDIHTVYQKDWYSHRGILGKCRLRCKYMEKYCNLEACVTALTAELLVRMFALASGSLISVWLSVVLSYSREDWEIFYWCV